MLSHTSRERVILLAGNLHPFLIDSRIIEAEAIPLVPQQRHRGGFWERFMRHARVKTWLNPALWVARPCSPPCAMRHSSSSRYSDLPSAFYPLSLPPIPPPPPWTIESHSPAWYMGTLGRASPLGKRRPRGCCLNLQCVSSTVARDGGSAWAGGASLALRGRWYRSRYTRYTVTVGRSWEQRI